MINSLYFDSTAYDYAYELERLIRNFSLPHKLDFYTGKAPSGTDYAYCTADGGRLSVTVSDSGKAVTERTDNSHTDDAETELCRLLCRCMEKLGHAPLQIGRAHV